jgi:D-alanyl-D-alanine carboxypeptidase
MRALLAALLLFSMIANGSCQGNADIDPQFRIGEADLNGATNGLSREIKDGIISDSKVFLGLLAQTLTGPQDLLVVVDKAHGLPPDSVPSDLVLLSAYPLTLTKTGMLLRKILLPDLLAMTKQARDDGADLPLSSTYRTFQQQTLLYENELATMSREEVERELAPPGHSQHQLGTVIDFGSIDVSFAETRAGKWLFANAWRFGFSLSYPEGGESRTGYTYEPWHYRYVGRSASELIHGFFSNDQQGFLSFYADKREFFSKRMR